MIALKEVPHWATAPPPFKPDISLPDHFSYSSMTTAQQCLRKWHYHYLQKAEPEFLSSSLLFGIALHAGAQKAHEMRIKGHTPDLAAVMAGYDQLWKDESQGKTIQYAKDENADSLKTMAIALFQQFLETVEPDLDRILAIEEKISLQIPGLPVPLVGRLDLSVENIDSIVIIDHKSARNSFVDKAPAAALQLALYAEALKSLAADLNKPIKGRFVIFRKLKTPKIEVIDVSLTEQNINRAMGMACSWWRLIESACAANAFPPNPDAFCKGCEYQRRCAGELVL